MRLIDADALMEIYMDRLSLVADRYSPDSSECGILAGAMKLLDEQPTIEPEPCEDAVSRQAAIDALERKKDKTAKGEIGSFYNTIIQHDIDAIVELPSAQSATAVRTKSNEPNRLENAIHGKTPEEIYEFIFWLFFRYAIQFTDSRCAIIDWLKGEEDESVN